MATVSHRVLGLLLSAGALCSFADDAGKAAAKAYSHPAKPSAAEADARERRETVTAFAPSAAAVPGPGRMQVEEPSAASSNAGARASKEWQKTHAKGLTEEQKSAFRERKEKMEGMIALIKAKRLALRDAKPEERAALARELHSLILEKDADAPSVAATVRVDDKEPAGKDAKEAAEAEAASARGKVSETQAQRREELRSRQTERHMQRKKHKDD